MSRDIIAQMVEALKPFAKAADEMDKNGLMKFEGIRCGYGPCADARAALAAAESTQAAHVIEPSELIALDALFEVASASFDAMDNCEITDDGAIIDKEDYARLNDAIDKLDDLPDDQPQFVMGPAAKAQWALRRLSGIDAPRFAAPVVSQSEPLEAVALAAKRAAESMVDFRKAQAVNLDDYNRESGSGLNPAPAQDVAVTPSSGCVFTDLGVDKPFKAKVRELIETWREKATKLHQSYRGTGTQDARKKAVTIHQCADELSAILSPEPSKSPNG